MCSWKPVLGLIPCSVRCSKSTTDPRIQTWLVPRSSSQSFVLLHAGNCSLRLSPWPGSSTLEKFYFFNGGKSQSYIELKIPIMDACLAESPTWSVVFPVMVPVSFAVCSKAVHIHLGCKGELLLLTGKQLLFIWSAEETLYSQCIYRQQHLRSSVVSQALLLPDITTEKQPKACPKYVTS